MQKYLVNSTYCIYLLELRQLYFDESIFTIKEVVDEVKHETGVVIEMSLAKPKKVRLQEKSDFLSHVELVLLQTAKAIDCILVSDDKRLITIAHKEGVRALDTPHFLHRLLIERKLSEEQILHALNKLKPLYNREYVIEKVIKDIKNWR